MTNRAFRTIVDETVAGLPAEFREKLTELPIVIRESPSAAELAAAGVSRREGLYGLFVGRPATERSVFDASGEPERIMLYRRPLVEDFPDAAELRREIRKTLLHEIGHFFGLTEADLDRLGYG